MNFEEEIEKAWAKKESAVRITTGVLLHPEPLIQNDYQYQKPNWDLYYLKKFYCAENKHSHNSLRSIIQTDDDTIFVQAVLVLYLCSIFYKLANFANLVPYL